MAYINHKQIGTNGPGAKEWIALNRWTNASNYTIFTKINGVVTDYQLESTIDMLNRMTPTEIASATVCPVENATGLTVDGCLNITATPLEFLRVNIIAGTGSVDVHVMQAGDHT
jgi:hypothetical protein